MHTENGIKLLLLTFTAALRFRKIAIGAALFMGEIFKVWAFRFGAYNVTSERNASRTDRALGSWAVKAYDVPAQPHGPGSVSKHLDLGRQGRRQRPAKNWSYSGQSGLKHTAAWHSPMAWDLLAGTVTDTHGASQLNVVGKTRGPGPVSGHLG